MQVCMFYRCFDISVYIYDTIAAGRAHALVYAQFVHLRWGTKVGGGSASLYRAFVRWHGGVIFDRRRHRGIISCLLYF